MDSVYMSILYNSQEYSCNIHEYLSQFIREFSVYIERVSFTIYYLIKYFIVLYCLAYPATK